MTFEYAIEVIEGISATIDGGIYNNVSFVPVNPLMLDETAIALLESEAGTALTALKNDLGEVYAYVAKGAVNAGNGAATNVSTYVNIVTRQVVVDAEMAAQEYKDIATAETAALTVGETVTTVGAEATRAGILAMDIGTAGPAVAVGLGLVSGLALYNIAPGFWQGVADTLLEAGELVDGKIHAIFDSNGNTSFSETTIEIIKNALLATGIFDAYGEVSAEDFPEDYTLTSEMLTSAVMLNNVRENMIKTINTYFPDMKSQSDMISASMLYKMSELGTPTTDALCNFRIKMPLSENDTGYVTFDNARPERLRYKTDAEQKRTFFEYSSRTSVLSKVRQLAIAKENPYPGLWETVIDGALYMNEVTQDLFYLTESWPLWRNLNTRNSGGFPACIDLFNYPIDFPMVDFYLPNIGKLSDNPGIQEGATKPSEEPFPSTYPDWHPSNNISGEDYYPISLPTEDGTQGPSQTGKNDKDDQKDKLEDLLDDTDPISDPAPAPKPEPDPETEGQTDPDEPIQQNVQPAEDPPDPNPDPEGSGVTPVMPIPFTTRVSKMYTVYNPTDGQIDDLGAYLWTDNIIEKIRQMWEDPMQAIISFHKVYCTPTTGANKNIYLGYLDSGVSAKEVTSQFATVDCGSLNVGERLQNATDYPPFTQCSLYLPFVGIVELDTTDIMGGRIHVRYTVDVYTGTCLAAVMVQRSTDMPNEQMLYTFSGNAAQQLPLTSASFAGAINALIGLAGAGVSVASGGAGIAIGAVKAAHSLTQEMIHVQHSGGLSSNAGIMAPRKPILIISRQSGYDANNYAAYYGYPANKTVFLSNLSGYVQVKYINLRTSATEEENMEIVKLLQDGVLI